MNGHSEVNLQEWIGLQTQSKDQIDLQPAHFMQATLDQDASLSDGQALPPLWHWLYFLEAKRASNLGRDAHPKKGGFLPPVALPRRMWAGGRFSFHTPLRLGLGAEKVSTIKSITEKQGRTGHLCFVTVEHKIFQGTDLCLTEEHDIVYREDPTPDAPKPTPESAPDNAQFSEIVQPTEVMLFRYSALTFNGHRIHYDIDYARNVEGYDGLVFHGPLTATLLVDLAMREAHKVPKTFQFMGISPLANLKPFQIEGTSSGNSTKLWAKNSEGNLAMQAEATF